MFCQLHRLLTKATNPRFCLAAMSHVQGIWRCDFEVFGIVQGVFFRKYTQTTASKLGLRGWCQNTSQGTVAGVLEGEAAAIKQMKEWLERTGSPQSRIDKAVFRDERKIDNYTFQEFAIRH